MCQSVCLGLNKMLTVIAARRCIHVFVCVFLCTRRMLPMQSLRGNTCMCWSVFSLCRAQITVIAARRCMLAVVCIFVPYEAVCLVCALVCCCRRTKIPAFII